MAGVTKTFRVYGREGHRQAESFHESQYWDFSNKQDGIRILDIRNSDKTGTNDYTEIAITRNTAEEVYDELEGQISDGLFENVCVGKYEEIVDTYKAYYCYANDADMVLIYDSKINGADKSPVLVQLSAEGDYCVWSDFCTNAQAKVVADGLFSVDALINDNLDKGGSVTGSYEDLMNDTNLDNQVKAKLTDLYERFDKDNDERDM